MIIVSTSFHRVRRSHPQRWLDEISFHTGILEKLAMFASVESVHCMDKRSVTSRNDVRYHFVATSWIQQLFPFKLIGLIRSLKPDVIILHGLTFPLQTWLLLKKFDSKVSIFIQHHAEHPLRMTRALLQKKNDRKVKGYFFSSAQLAKPWIEQGLISEASKIHETMEVSSIFSQSSKTKAREITKVEGERIYLWVGRLDSNKDPLTLIQSFHQFSGIHPNARLYIVFQEGHLLENMKKIITQFSLQQVIFLVGKIAHDQMENWYNSADYIISTSHYEGSGLAVCEAMSCGCIPILTNIPSFRFMTRNGQVGFLFSKGSSEDLATKLLQSSSIDLEAETKKIIANFQTRLSFSEIARSIYETVNLVD